MELIEEEELTEVVKRCAKIRRILEAAQQDINYQLGQLEYLTRVIDFRMTYADDNGCYDDDDEGEEDENGIFVI